MPVAAAAGIRLSHVSRTFLRTLARLPSTLALPITAPSKAHASASPRARRRAALRRPLFLLAVLVLLAALAAVLAPPFISRAAPWRRMPAPAEPLAPGFEGATRVPADGPAAPGSVPFRIILVIPPFTDRPRPSSPSYSAPAKLDVPADAGTYSARALALLVESLGHAHYDNEPVMLQLVLAPQQNASAFERRYRQCVEVAWPHGRKVVQNATTGGLFELGVGSWNPTRGDSQKVLIVDASRALPFVPQYYRYLKSVRRRHARNTADIAGFTLEPVLVRRHASVLGRRTGAYTSARVEEGEAGDEVFLYQNLPFVAAFSPADAEVWRSFQRWFAAHRSEWFLWPTVVGAKDKSDAAWGSYRGTARAHWTLWFSRFCVEYGIYTVYPRRHRPEPLPPVGRTSALPPLSRFSFEGEPVQQKQTINAENLEKIVELGRRQGGSVSMTVVNAAFLETARSWICNVDVAGFRPPGVVWITTDDESYEGLRHVPNAQTVRMTEFRGGQARTGTSYGTPGYWLLMLERTQLILAILERGIGVFAFETDQVWLRDPVPFVQRLIHSGDEVDVVGTLDTRHEIGGNFLYLNPTLATRRTWREVCRRFENAYKDNKMDGHTARFRRYMENDQSTLTKLIFFDDKFKSRNPVVFRALDTELFVDGRWYDSTSNQYTSARSRSPIVINNNFLIGIDNKKKRAAQHGHWFLGADGRTCDQPLVNRAVRENEIRAGGDAAARAPTEGHDGEGASGGGGDGGENEKNKDRDEDSVSVSAARMEGADVEAGLDAAMMAIGKEQAL